MRNQPKRVAHVVLLTTPVTRAERVVTYVIKHPGCTKNAIVAALGSSDRGSSRQEMFNRLEDEGLIRVEREHPRRSQVFPGPALKRKR